MKIHIATDHAGFELKQYIEQRIHELNFNIVDHGAFELDQNDDYVDYIRSAAREVSRNPTDQAIIFGGSGQGEAMVANREKNVRATVWYGGPIDIIKLSREHNDANVLSIGARFVSAEEAWEVIKLWLETSFTHDERHVRRIGMIDSGLSL